MKNVLTALLVIVLCVQLSAQTPKGLISSRVLDTSTSTPIEEATVLLKDSFGKTLRGTSTDKSGVFVFDYVTGSDYIIEVSFVGYQSKKIERIAPSSKPLAPIFLSSSSVALSEVLVIPEVTSIQTYLGQRVVNVGKDLQTTGNASKDLMNNLPSTIVDMKGNMTLRGSSNVRYFIDGRPTNLSSMELMNILPANAIEKVELVTSPSAKEYSDGLSGIVNIITSKPKMLGFNSSINLGYGTGDKYNAGIDLNYRTDKVNVWASYLYFQNRNWLRGDVSKTDVLPSQSSTIPKLSQQIVEGYYLGNTHEVKAGVDYNISDNTIISYTGALRSVWRDSKMNILSSNYTSIDKDKVSTAYNSDALSHSKMNVLSNSLRFSHTFDAKNRIEADFNYEIDHTTSNNYFTQTFTTKPMPMMPDSVLDTTTYKNNYSYLSGRIDYTNQGTNYKFELGASAYRRTMDNPYQSHSITNMPRPIPAVNTIYNSHFDFTEDVMALYFTYSRTFGALSTKIGLRVEQSTSLVRSLDTDKKDKERFESDTLDIYPSLHLSYKLNPNSSFMLGYSRRVARPDTRQLNPNAVSTNPARPNIGNPYLRPEYSNAVELTYKGVWDRLDVSSSLFYRYNTDVIQQYLTPTNPITGSVEQGKIFNTFKNYGTSYFIGFEAIASADITNYLWLSGSFNAYYVDYATESNSLWNNCGINTIARLSANVKVTTQLSAMLLGRYQGQQTYIQGVEQANATMDLGLRYDLFSKKMSITARLTDVFDSFGSRSSSLVDVSSKQDGSKIQREVNFENYETRVFYLTLAYRF